MKLQGFSPSWGIWVIGELCNDFAERDQREITVLNLAQRLGAIRRGQAACLRAFASFLRTISRFSGLR